VAGGAGEAEPPPGAEVERASGASTALAFDGSSEDLGGGSVPSEQALGIASTMKMTERATCLMVRSS